jgi:hypothetical protein
VVKADALEEQMDANGLGGMFGGDCNDADVGWEESEV